ncbi:helix-turn-helix domain-containing protein [Campylobacter curvus]|uniref:helix-turn-helix domain-containing protein n=1 Tax=Campylobacter curvus TaxID=200 RepID=UPI0014700298|nr:helix-turn-helix domain-containing protein [Campylobacter curvus]
MWVDSKSAAEILGIDYATLRQAVARAKKIGKKFCKSNSNILHFCYTDGIGRGGKTLQFSLDEETVRSYDPDLADKLSSSEISPADTKESRDSFDDRNCGVGSLNFIEKDGVNASSINRAKSSQGIDKNDDTKQRGGVYGVCGTYAKNGLCSEKERARGVWLQTGDKEELGNVKFRHDNRDNSASTNDNGGRIGSNACLASNFLGTRHQRDTKNQEIARKNINRSEVLAFCKDHSIKAASREYGIPEKTIYRWMKEFENKGGKALVDKRGGKARADTKMIKDAILTIGTAHKTSWWMEYCRIYCVKNSLDFDMYDLHSDISRATFFRHADEIAKNDREVRDYLRSGKDMHIRPTINRTWLKPNEEWQIDATKFDFMCLDENGEQKRYTAICMVDVGSGRRVMELFDSANSYANVRLLKKAFEKMGRPGFIKGDNGKDYVSEHFQGVLKRIGVLYVKARPFAGYEKGKVERSFGQIQSFFEPLPGFLGHNAGERMHKEAQALEKSKRLSGVKTNIENLLTRNEMQTMIDEYADRLFFKEEVNFEPFVFDKRLLGVSVDRMLQADGFSINGVKYINLEIFNYIKIGDKCELVEDIDDASKFYVYKDETYLCEVFNEDVLEYSAEEVKAAQKEYKKTHIKPLISLIDKLTDEKDAFFKAQAQNKLKDIRKGKAEVIKKDSKKVSVKMEFEAEVANSPVYLPDIDEAIKSLEV